MSTLKGKTLFMTGGSRGIGRAIALRAAADGANIAIAAKTSAPHPKLPGTIRSVARDIEAAGGRALALEVDIRDDERLGQAVHEAVDTFGGIDILVNNASAIYLAGTAETPMKRFDLMHAVNTRGTFAASQACLPYLRRAANPHILTLSPPLDMNPHWFADHCAYIMSKFGMSMCVLGMAEEFREHGIAVNALWPRCMVHTAASGQIGIEPEQCRTVEIMADAAHAVLVQDSRQLTGRFLFDDEVLAARGIADFGGYQVVPGAELTPDLFSF
jgi:citronellol/citronellal dehydrogenase